jgi:hypothetical protein
MQKIGIKRIGNAEEKNDIWVLAKRLGGTGDLQHHVELPMNVAIFDHGDSLS